MMKCTNGKKTKSIDEKIRHSMNVTGNCIDTQCVLCEKIRHSMNATGNCIDTRYIDRQHIDIQCVLCECDLSRRNDWEPFLQGIGDAYTDYALHGETARAITAAPVCFACIDKIHDVSAVDISEPELVTA